MPFAGLVTSSLISAGGSLLGGLFGSSAAKKASEQQSKDAQYASDLAGQAGKDSEQEIRNAQGQQSANYGDLTGKTQANFNTLQDTSKKNFDTSQAGFGALDQKSQANFDASKQAQNPFLSTGTQAQLSLADLMKPGGALYSTAQFQAPTNITEQNDPGFQARLAAGQQALERSAAAKGRVLNAGTSKALGNFAQDYASNEYGNVYARALGEYQQGIANQNNQYNRLAQLAGTGQHAADTLGNLTGTFNSQQGQNQANQANNATAYSSQQGANTTAFNAQQGQNTSTYNQQLGNNANSIAGIKTGTAATQGADLTGGANARAAGIVGSSNALTGGINGAINSLSPIALYNLFQGGVKPPSGGPGGSNGSIDWNGVFTSPLH